MSTDLNRITLGNQGKNMLAVGISQERARWVAAVDALYEEKKSDYQEDGSDVTLQYFEGATTVLEELLNMMQAQGEDVPTVTSNNAAKMIVTAGKQRDEKWVAAVEEFQDELTDKYIKATSLTRGALLAKMDALEELLTRMEAS